MGLVGHSLAKKLRYLFLYVVIVTAVGYLYVRLPSAYLPDEDQGMLLCQIRMPVGAALEQTQEVADEVADYFQEHESEAVASCLTIAGVGFSGTSQNNAMVFVKLRDWDERERPDLKVGAVARRAMGAFAAHRNAIFFAFPPPPVSELGNATGVRFPVGRSGRPGPRCPYGGT